MNEYCVVFFALIKEAMILDGYEYSILGNISLLPHLKKHDAKKLMDTFKSMGVEKDKSDIEADRKRLRKLLSSKRKVV
jgi:hypothetical protein